MKITKNELNKLAQAIRNENTGNNAQAVLWAVKYHLPLVLWQIEKPIDLVNALVIACQSGTETSVCNILGVERSIEIGAPLLTCSTGWKTEGMIESEEAAFQEATETI